MLTKFGKQLRSLRLETNQRLKDMAGVLGVTVAYLSAVENGKRAIPDNWIEKIADEYHLSDDEVASLQMAAFENKRDVRLDLNGLNEAEVGLTLSFARRFKNLSDDQVSELQKILDDNYGG